MIVQRRYAALTMRVVQAEDYAEPRDALSHDWYKAVVRWGLMPLPVPNLLKEPSSCLDNEAIALLVLTGGDDPGEPAARHATEIALIEAALTGGIPVIGVCRGAQVVNLYFGGSLETVTGHVGEAHEITVESSFDRIYNAVETVNSFHNLGIPPHGLASPLRAAAHDRHGFVEAFHHADRPIVGVMWHPERDGAPGGDTALVRHLIESRAFWI